MNPQKVPLPSQNEELMGFLSQFVVFCTRFKVRTVMNKQMHDRLCRSKKKKKKKIHSGEKTWDFL